MEQKTKIIIVDDENQILATYQNYFQKRDFQADVASDGEQGLKMLREGEYDVAIIDIRMPKLDGISLAQKMREEGIDTSIVILTGHGEKEDAVKAVNLNVDAWFEKANIKMDELLARVKQLAQVMPLDEIRKVLSVIPASERSRSK